MGDLPTAAYQNQKTDIQAIFLECKSFDKKCVCVCVCVWGGGGGTAQYRVKFGNIVQFYVAE